MGIASLGEFPRQGGNTRVSEIVMKRPLIPAKTLLALAASTLIVSGPAQAVPITTSGVWENPTGTPETLATITGEGTNTLGWGTPLFMDQSSWVFAGIVGDLPDNPDGQRFELGTFTHRNRALFPDASADFTGADLLLTLAIGSTEQDFTFGFGHIETPNEADPCAEGGNPPCPDLVSILTPTALELFVLDGMLFEFTLLGFSQDGGNTIVSEFLTLENADNSASLFGTFRKVEVPEPLTITILGLGLFGIAAYTRRRRLGS